MRTSLIGPTYPFRGGIAHYNTLLERELRQKHPVQFISFRSQYPAWMFPGETDKDSSERPILPEHVEYLLDPLRPWTWIQVARRIRHYSPDLILLHWWVPFWAAPFRAVTALAKRHTAAKVCFICHNVLPHEHSKLDRFLAQLGLREGNGFITHSAEQRDCLLSILPEASIRCTPHPTYAAFRTGAWTKKSARQELSIDPNEKLLLFFGFVRPYKGLHHLLAAMPYVLQQIQVRLLVVGEFWKGRLETAKQVSHLGLDDHITLIDKYVPNEDIELFFSAADVVVLPYEAATGSGVLQMAMGLETPSIVTDVGGLSGIIVHEETGLVVPPSDPQALAEAIVRYYEEGLEDRFVKNIQLHRGRFSWDTLLDVIEELGDSM